MTNINYSKSERDGKVSLAVVLDGEIVTVGDNHPAFNKILGYVANGGSDEALVAQWYEAEKFVTESLTKLTDLVSIEDGKLFYGDDQIDTALSRHILRLFREGDAEFTGFARFLERLAKNPSPLSRYNLFTWLNAADFTITDDGLIVAYKSVNRHGNYSHASGPQVVTVNGVDHTGFVPNPYGATVRIARESVDPDRTRECSYGLHVGTYQYARNTYNGLLLKVYVDPEDVVAVPRDCNGQKMRVCGYVVAKNETGEDEEEVLVPQVSVPLFADIEADDYDESRIPVGDIPLDNDVEEEENDEESDLPEDHAPVEDLPPFLARRVRNVNELEVDGETEVEPEPTVNDEPESDNGVAPTDGAVLKVKPNGQRYWSYRDSKGRWARLEIGTN